MNRARYSRVMDEAQKRLDSIEDKDALAFAYLLYNTFDELPDEIKKLVFSVMPEVEQEQ